MAAIDALKAEDWQPLADRLKQLFIERLAAQDHNATGALSNSIEMVVKREGSGWVIECWANAYGRYVNNGRQAGGRMPNPSIILQWMNERNIGNDLTKEYQRRGLAFVIARSIADKGIPPQGGYSAFYEKGNTINRTGWVDKVLEENEEEITKYFEDILEELVELYVFNKYRNQIKQLK